MHGLHSFFNSPFVHLNLACLFCIRVLNGQTSPNSFTLAVFQRTCFLPTALSPLALSIPLLSDAIKLIGSLH